MLRPADVPQTWGNPALAGERLGWAPKTSLKALVAHMVAADLERLRTGVEEAPALLEPATVGA
jgi:GDPmannose 4,6-dehydratase